MRAYSFLISAVRAKDDVASSYLSARFMRLLGSRNALTDCRLLVAAAATLGFTEEFEFGFLTPGIPYSCTGSPMGPWIGRLGGEVCRQARIYTKLAQGELSCLAGEQGSLRL